MILLPCDALQDLGRQAFQIAVLSDGQNSGVIAEDHSGQPMILRFLIDVRVKVVDHSRVRSNTKKPCAQTAQSFSQIKPFRTQSCLAAYFTWPQVAITHHVSNKEFSEYRTAGQPVFKPGKGKTAASVCFTDCGTFHTWTVCSMFNCSGSPETCGGHPWRG